MNVASIVCDTNSHTHTHTHTHMYTPLHTSITYVVQDQIDAVT